MKNHILNFSLALFFMLLSYLSISQTKVQSHAFKAFEYTREDIDYEKYFSSPKTPEAKNRNITNKNYSGTNIPFLDIGTIVPNGGSLRSFQGKVFKHEGDGLLWDVFEESPYQTSPPMLYYRFSWCTLEDNEGNYLFDEVLEPLLEKCVSNRARLSMGLLINSYSTASEYAGFTKDDDGTVRKYSVPTYIFNHLQRSMHPMIKDDLYAHWWSANMDSPYLYKRFKAFVKALNQWLKWNVTGTSIKRRDVIFAIEERYLGYWGEGGMRKETLPKTSLVNKYHNLVVSRFKDKIIIAPGQLLGHLPQVKDTYSGQEIVIMKSVYNMLSKGTRAGAIGLFRDSWGAYSYMYDIISKRVMMDKKGNIVPLALYLHENTYAEGYNTGEFGFLQYEGRDGNEPYKALYNSFKLMRMGGISVHNFSVTVMGGKNNHRLDPSPYYQRGRDMLSVTGYRIVMGTPEIIINKNGTYTVNVPFSNIGTSRVFADYYRPHLIVKDDKGDVINDFICSFDMRTVIPSENNNLGVYRSDESVVMSYTIPRIDKTFKHVDLYIRIDDEKGIEYPMTLSNYGRFMENNGGDGSYYLGELK